MSKRRKPWLSAIGVVLVSGVLFLASFGSGGVQAAGNPLDAIVAKLDQILTAIGNIQEGNHTLRWDTVQPAAQRFVVLASFANAAVLDKETGLVWEQSPHTTTHTWNDARFQCTSRTTGGRKGWRLSSVHELASLVDPSVASPGPTLPPGHPFTNVQSANYWSATESAGFPTDAWEVDFFLNGTLNGTNKTRSFRAWCVRGPMQESVY